MDHYDGYDPAKDKHRDDTFSPIWEDDNTPGVGWAWRWVAPICLIGAAAFWAWLFWSALLS